MKLDFQGEREEHYVINGVEKKFKLFIRELYKGCKQIVICENAIRSIIFSYSDFRSVMQTLKLF